MNKNLLIKSIVAFVVIVLVSMAVFLVVKGKEEPLTDDIDVTEDAVVQELVPENESTSTPVTEPTITTKPSYNFTAAQKRRAEQLTSLFENGTIEISYGYIENLDDGRGYTAGRAGFTSADGDLYLVVQEYTKLKANNKLAKYLPTLRNLADKGSDSVKDLKDLEKAWSESAGDSSLIKAQDLIVDKLYYVPSKTYADKLELKLPISRAFLYDTIIQHGDGKDADSISALLDRAHQKVGGSPADGVDEIKWLYALIQVRRDDLKNPYNKETKDEWSQSTGRCDVMKKILDDKNYQLQGPIIIKTSEYKATIN